jgi:hypothetical protein
MTSVVSNNTVKALAVAWCGVGVWLLQLCQKTLPLLDMWPIMQALHRQQSVSKYPTLLYVYVRPKTPALLLPAHFPVSLAS